MATTIQDLEERVDALYNSILQMQQNLNPVTEKADTTANKVEQITPTTYTKTAYIGDTSVTFDNVPSGNLSILTDAPLTYSYTRENNIVVISFDELSEVINITISII